MTKSKVTRNWNERGIEMACSTDEDARIGFLVNAYMSCDRKQRDAIIAAAGGIADVAAKIQADSLAPVFRFIGTGV